MYSVYLYDYTLTFSDEVRLDLIYCMQSGSHRHYRSSSSGNVDCQQVSRADLVEDCICANQLYKVTILFFIVRQAFGV